MRSIKNILGKLNPRSFAHKPIPNFESITSINQIPEIFEWVFNPDIKIAQDCAHAIHRLITTQTTFQNKSLYASLSYIQIKQEDFTWFNNFELDIQKSLMCVASMNGDGYIREHALKFLIQHPTQKTFLFVLFRLTDWVSAIRQAAEVSINQMVQAIDPLFLIKHHKIIEWLLKVQRADLRGIHKDIIELIFAEVNIDQITQNVEAYEEKERYFIFKNLITRHTIDGQLLEKGLNDKSYLIRLLVVRNMAIKKHPDVLKKMLSDRNQKIRHYAISHIAEEQLRQFQTNLDYLLFDNSASIRSIARRLLSKICDIDYPQRYRTEILKKIAPGNIIGLAEVGDKTDLHRFTSLLQSNYPKHRTAGLLAISILDYEMAKEEAFKLLNDSSNTVKKACLSIITKMKLASDLPKMRNIYDQGTSSTKRFVLKAISRYGGWGIAGDFLKGIQESDVQLKKTACSFLETWYSYSIRLGAKQPEHDARYVMDIYKNLDLLDVPENIKKIIDNIPFIFGEN
ncbi:hypothetical protein BKI52_38925 [marine bacterium AO1-C]|nr:hypothetical protein BKI52_38925 [marine bacterium AO1-C]